jgi:hypothetical protein
MLTEMIHESPSARINLYLAHVHTNLTLSITSSLFTLTFSFTPQQLKLHKTLVTSFPFLFVPQET